MTFPKYFHLNPIGLYTDTFSKNKYMSVSKALHTCSLLSKRPRHEKKRIVLCVFFFTNETKLVFLFLLLKGLYFIINNGFDKRGLSTDKPTITNIYFDVWILTPPQLLVRTARWGVHRARGFISPAPRHNRKASAYAICPEAYVQIASRHEAIGHASVTWTFWMWILRSIFFKLLFTIRIHCLNTWSLLSCGIIVNKNI